MNEFEFFEMRFDLGTLDSGERSLPFGLLVIVTDGIQVDRFPGVKMVGVNIFKPFIEFQDSWKRDFHGNIVMIK